MKSSLSFAPHRLAPLNFYLNSQILSGVSNIPKLLLYLLLVSAPSCTMTSNGLMGLLKRHPSLTREQFSDYWLNTHAAIAIPWALANGCVHYVQIHNPRLTTAAAVSPPADLDIAEWDGAAELVFEPPPGFKESAKAKDFFRRVVVPDEKKFLIDEARKHAKFVDAGMVEGERIVLVENGKIAVDKDGQLVVDITEAMKVWDEWVVEDDEGK
jgi:hypothetical protein